MTQEEILEDYLLLANCASRLDDIDDDLAESIRSHLDKLWADMTPKTTGDLKLANRIERGDILNLVLGY